MTWTVFLAVLLAAVLHASWNALVKVSADRLSAMGLLTLASGVIGLVFLPFVPAPSPAAWPFLAGSVLLHIGYRLFLVEAYRHGDLSHVYPISRGTGPLIVALLSAAIVGEQMGLMTALGVTAIALGVIALAFRGGPAVLERPEPLLYALGTGLFIAGYTLTDGLGGRANDGHGAAYVVWLLTLDAPIFVAIVWIRRGDAFWHAIRENAWSGLAGGGMSLAAYALAVWAMTLAPLAAVAALRETSVIFAALIGRLLLKEGFGVWRLAASCIVAAGVALLRA
jgi:drug/metabolite transporter (DMT)-like permease